MPRFDGTGPLGEGPFSGRGEGYCAVKLPDAPGEPTVGYAGQQGRSVHVRASLGWSARRLPTRPSWSRRTVWRFPTFWRGRLRGRGARTPGYADRTQTMAPPGRWEVAAGTGRPMGRRANQETGGGENYASVRWNWAKRQRTDDRRCTGMVQSRQPRVERIRHLPASAGGTLAAGVRGPSTALRP